MARPTIEDLARHAQIPAPQLAQHSDDLTRYLSAATGHVEAYCGPMTDGQVQVRMNHARTLVLPFIGVTSATVTHGTDEVVVDTAGCDYAAGVVVVHARRLGYYTVTVTRDQRASDALWLATLIIAAHLWDVRRGAAPPTQFGQEVTPGLGVAVPRRAETLMTPWMTPVLA